MVTTLRTVLYVTFLFLIILVALWRPLGQFIGQKAVTYFKEHPAVLDEIVSAHQNYKQQEQDKQNLTNIQKHDKDLFVQIDGIPVMGNPNGTVAINLFVEPFCSACRQFKEVITKVTKELPDVKFIVRDIPFLTPTSNLVIQGLLAANIQGKYDVFQNEMTSIEPTIDMNGMVAIAQKVGLDVEKFKTDMASPAVAKTIERNLKLAQDMELGATPMLILKDRVLVGAVPFENLKEVLYPAKQSGDKNVPGVHAVTEGKTVDVKPLDTQTPEAKPTTAQVSGSQTVDHSPGQK